MYFHYRFRAPFTATAATPYNGQMARGFDSKFVEAQQDEAARGKAARKPELSPERRAAEQQRRILELTRTRTRQDLSRATAPAHKRMLEQAIAALDRQLEELATHVI
jgi:hypothetical protein